jgi:hypothetical protein
MAKVLLNARDRTSALFLAEEEDRQERGKNDQEREQQRPRDIVMSAG